MRFNMGQKVICVKKTAWELVSGSGKLNCPRFNEIVTVLIYDPVVYDGEYFFNTEEYPLKEFYAEKNFAPLMDIPELTEILEQQPDHA